MILIGTLVFVLLSVLVYVGLTAYVRSVSLGSRVGMNVRITGVSVLIGGFCMWLMWICTYMHQLNPLISPIYAK